MSYLQATHLSKQYGSGDAAVDAVRDASLSLEKGEFVAIMGESGSGKSTLLSMLGALNSPSRGTYTVGGQDVYALHPERRADFRRQNLGFVFQSFHLLPYLSLAENAMLPLLTAEMARREKRALAEEALARVGLQGKGHRLPAEVSGGEAERAAIARALVNRPPLILADEPTGNLDSRNGRDVMRLLSRLAADGVAVVMVAHSRDCAAFAHRILHMSDGSIAGEEVVPREAGSAAA